MFIELNYQEQPVRWKKKGWGERKQVVRGCVYQKSEAPLMSSLPSPLFFLPLEMAIISSESRGLEKRFGVCVSSKYSENCCCVCKLCMGVYN